MTTENIIGIVVVGISLIGLVVLLCLFAYTETKENQEKQKKFLGEHKQILKDIDNLYFNDKLNKINYNNNLDDLLNRIECLEYSVYELEKKEKLKNEN